MELITGSSTNNSAVNQRCRNRALQTSRADHSIVVAAGSLSCAAVASSTIFGTWLASPRDPALHPPSRKAPSGHCVWRLGGMRRASSPNKLLRQTCCVRTLSKTEWKNQDDALIALACVSAFCSMCAISMWCLPWLQTRLCPTTVRGGERSQKTLQVVHLR